MDCPSGCDENHWTCNIACFECTNPPLDQFHNVASLALIQTMGVFMMTAGMTYAYMMYTNTLGIFTLLTPLIFGGISCVMFLMGLCAEDEANCVKFIINWFFCMMKNAVEEVLHLIASLFGFDIINPTWVCDG